MGLIARANPPFGTQFLINLLPPPPPTKSTESEQATPTVEGNPLHHLYPPISMPTAGFGLQPPGAPGPGDVFYPNTKVIIQYLADAVPRAVTAKCFDTVTASRAQPKTGGESSATPGDEPNPSRWYLNSDATGLSCEDRADVLDAKEDFGLQFKMPLLGPDGEETEGGRPELRASGYFVENGQPVKRSWSWDGADKVSPQKVKDLVALVAPK